MKKIFAFSVFVCCSVLMIIVAGCSSPDILKGKSVNDKSSYIQTINAKLVSFTDCANAFSDSLEQIADRKYAPSEKQTADIQNKLDRLEKACAALAGEKAPAEYSEAQAALDEAMADYAVAIEKCNALLEFYDAYESMFRKYKNPDKGSAEIEIKEREIYGEFAQAMQKATDSFRAACEKFDNAKPGKSK